MRALFVDKQENAHSIFQRGCEYQKIARVLNMNMGSVHNIKKTYLFNVNCSCRGRPWLLNTKMEWSCMLQVMTKS